MSKIQKTYSYILLALLFGFMHITMVHANFLDQVIEDTTELYPQGRPTLFAGAAYDLREPGNSKTKW